MRPALLLCCLLAASGCAPAYATATHREPPVWLFAADMVAFSAGSIVGLNEYNEPDSDVPVMSAGFALALAAWLPYWFVPTDGRP